MERTELITELVSVFGGIKRSMHGKTYLCENGEQLSIGQLMVLFAIMHHGPISGQELASRLSMTPGGISQLVDSLVAGGFIDRTPKLADRRVHELTLSKQGKQQVGAIERERFAMISYRNERVR